MNNITNESITLDEIWTVFNETNPDGEYLLTLGDEVKITNILTKYGEVANVCNTREEPALHIQNVSKRVLPPWVRPTIMVVGVLAIIAFTFNVC